MAISAWRLINRQEHSDVVLEVFEGPDGRRVRFFVKVAERACSEVWTGTEWKEVHSLVGRPKSIKYALPLLYITTEDILGWKA